MSGTGQFHDLQQRSLTSTPATAISPPLLSPAAAATLPFKPFSPNLSHAAPLQTPSTPSRSTQCPRLNKRSNSSKRYAAANFTTGCLYCNPTQPLRFTHLPHTSTFAPTSATPPPLQTCILNPDSTLQVSISPLDTRSRPASPCAPALAGPAPLPLPATNPRPIFPAQYVSGRPTSTATVEPSSTTPMPT